jgi:hypothetical protein
MQLFGIETYTIYAVKNWPISFSAGGASFGTFRHWVGPFSLISTPKLAMLECDPFSSIRSLADSLDIVSSTVHHLTNVLYFRLLHLRWVLLILIDEFCANRMAKAKELFDLLDVQRRIEYRGILTGDES